MDTQQITVDREEAGQLFRKYQEHRHWSRPVDLEIQRTYGAIAKGKVVIQALASIAAAGLGEGGYPKLAIVRAAYDETNRATGDVEEVVTTDCLVSMSWAGGAQFSADRWSGAQYRRRWIELPADSFPREVKRPRSTAISQVPLIPIHLRPKRGLANYHILYEAEWKPVPPKDPLLLRHIGYADLWIVCAAWDLTEIERAVLAGRLGRG